MTSTTQRPTPPCHPLNTLTHLEPMVKALFATSNASQTVSRHVVHQRRDIVRPHSWPQNIKRGGRKGEGGKRLSASRVGLPFLPNNRTTEGGHDKLNAGRMVADVIENARRLPKSSENNARVSRS